MRENGAVHATNGGVREHAHIRLESGRFTRGVAHDKTQVRFRSRSQAAPPRHRVAVGEHGGFLAACRNRSCLERGTDLPGVVGIGRKTSFNSVGVRRRVRQFHFRRERVGVAAFVSDVGVSPIFAGGQLWQRHFKSFLAQLHRMQVGEGIQTRFTHQEEVHHLAVVGHDRVSIAHVLPGQAQDALPAFCASLRFHEGGVIKPVVAEVRILGLPPFPPAPNQHQQ